MMVDSIFKNFFKAHISCFEKLEGLEAVVMHAAGVMTEALGRENKILVCGNGGSAADAQHFSAELVGRFALDRNPFASIALHTDTSTLTAVANDYGYNDVFSRQVKALGKKGDVLVGISTSGNSENVVHAVKAAAFMGIATVGLLGRSGGKLKEQVDVVVTVPAQETARIQEAHIFILHVWAAVLEKKLGKKKQPK